MIIAIDVDITLVQMGHYWYEWLCKETNYFPDHPTIDCPYNLVELFDGKITYDDAMMFWQQKNLYQQYEPLPDAVNVIDDLKRKGYDIGFVSYCKKGHFSSKCDWLKEWFPYLSFINVTKEKQYTRADIFIDDRVDYMINQPDNVKCILIDSAYKQNLEIPDHFIQCRGWKHIGDYLL